jgi:hypothetical protein
VRCHTSVRKTAAVSRAASIRAEEELLDRAMNAIPQLPVGPSAGAAAAVLILGSDGAAAAGSQAVHPRRRRHEAWSRAPPISSTCTSAWTANGAYGARRWSGKREPERAN